MVFDLMDVTHVNDHIIYMKLGDEISLPNFKIVVAKALIGKYSNCNRSLPATRPSKRKFHHPSMTTEVPNRMPEVQ